MKTLLDRAHWTGTEGQAGPRWTIIQAQTMWTNEQRTHMHDIVQLTQKLGATAIIIAYCNTANREELTHAEELQNLAKTIEWTIYKGQLKKTKADGYVEANTHYFILSRKDITDAWKTSKAMDDDEPDAMEAILDINDGIFEDCNRYQVNVDNERKQPGNNYYAQIKGRINIAPYDEEDRIHAVYHIHYPIPNLAMSDDIMVEATNGVTHQKSRPLRKHETLTALGHTGKVHEWTGHENWQVTYERLQTVTPRHTWERIIATLHALEMETTTNETTEAIPEQTRTMVARIINRWTTLPEPTTEDWKNATATDHDLRRVKTTLETGMPLLKAGLHEKRYNLEWTKDKLELDNRIIYQYEEPKATKIRQLRR